jgi:hypothetical protein
MDAVGFITFAVSIIAAISVIMLFLAYYINQMTVRNMSAATSNLQVAQLLLQTAQQYATKAEVEHAAQQR